jgi:hypothetical protein
MHIVAAPRAKARRYDHIQAAHMQVVHHTRDFLAAASQAALVPTILQQLVAVVVQMVHDIPDTVSHPRAAQRPSF